MRALCRLSARLYADIARHPVLWTAIALGPMMLGWFSAFDFALGGNLLAAAEVLVAWQCAVRIYAVSLPRLLQGAPATAEAAE